MRGVAMRWSAPGMVLVVAAIVAATAHILLSVALPWCVDTSYGHVSVAPLLSGGLIGAAVAFASVVRRCVGAAERKRMMRVLARQTTCIPPLVMWLTVSATALVVFCVGEGIEQIAAFGHLLPISVHYDSLLVMAGLFVGCSGIACAILRSLLQLVIATVTVVVEWLFSARSNLGHLHRSTRAALSFIPPSKQLALESATRRGPPVALALG
jgi:hypothetical protein